MNLNSFMPVHLVTGAGCVRSSAKVLSGLGSRCLIVTGKHAAKACGALKDVTDILDENGQRWVLFDEIGQNPQLTDCMAAAEKAIGFGADFVLGIGGGSALDAAKCIAVLAANPGMTQAQLYAFDWANKPLKIVAVGTTAGTGSEVTKVSVITTPEGRKKSFHHEAIFPALSLGDPTYTMTLSPMVTRSTMVDVLAHCAESFFSRSANHLSQCYAVEGIRLLLPVFRTMAEEGFDSIDYETRETLYCASIYGGLAINVTGTCFPHTMGYLLTERFGIPHGTACAVFQPDFYEYNKAVVPELAQQFLERIGCSEEEYLALLEKLTPPCNISMSESLIAESHSRWINNGSMAKSQGTFSADMADAVLRRKFGSAQD
ncbi:MAG: iron-containing alcohol dehydrogenase [Oscillospiraceae bacterium]|nr:iron-containing alcohol dehydrogenase [Oscillospiraceae bacterium]